MDKLQEIDSPTITPPSHAALAKASHFCHGTEDWDVGLYPRRKLEEVIGQNIGRTGGIYE